MTLSGLTRRRAYGLGSGTFSAEDLVDLFGGQQGPAPEATAEVLFAESQRGHVFTAHGRRWKVVNDAVGHRARLIVGDPPQLVKHGKNLAQEDTLFAQLDDDGVLTVSALSKRGPARPVGKPLWRESLRRPPGMPVHAP